MDHVDGKWTAQVGVFHVFCFWIYMCFQVFSLLLYLAIVIHIMDHMRGKVLPKPYFVNTLIMYGAIGGGLICKTKRTLHFRSVPEEAAFNFESKLVLEIYLSAAWGPILNTY